MLDILDTSVYEKANLTFIKVTMVSTGDGPVGASKLTGEVGVKNNNDRINIKQQLLLINVISISSL